MNKKLKNLDFIILNVNLKMLKLKINKNIMSNSKAFSLIELSIVLIIVGLLISGIFGGANLIISAKNRAFMNEIANYKRAVFAFKAIKGRYPGDIRNTGKFGHNSGYTYLKTDFAPPFDTGSFVPSAVSAPFIELYTEKLSDFKPTGNSQCVGYPCSKVYNYSYYYYYSNDTSTDPLNYLYNFKTNIIVLGLA